MESPLLLQGRKFDIRVWALLTQDNRLFMFKEGYVRLTSTEFSLDAKSISKPEIHLTNNAVQSTFKDYGKFEEGNIISFLRMQEGLDESGGMPDFVKQKLVPDIKH